MSRSGDAEAIAPKAPKPAGDDKPAPNKPAAKEARRSAPEPAKRGEVVRYPSAPKRAVARPAAPRRRHRLVGLSFLLAVVAPALAAGGYLYGYAADQYDSRVAFSIRGNEPAAPAAFLGALTQTFTGGGTDAEIVYEFLRSQQMVETALAALPLREIYGAPETDPVFTLDEDAPIEDVVDYWNWMTDVTFDGATGIVNFSARAFDPESARAISRLALEESTRIVNELSIQAREDAVGVAREVLEAAEARLRQARLDVRAFRREEREFDPVEGARASFGLAAALEESLAEAEVELATTMALVGERAAELPYLRQRIESLKARIAEERDRIGGEQAAAGPAAGGPGRPLADLLAEYEELAVDLEFAETAYTSALAAFEQAQVEARRQMRYLSPHVRPTLSVEPQYPQRALLTAGVALALTVSWAVLVLIAYNIRDRR